MSFLLLLVALGLAEASLPEGHKVCEPHSRPWHVYLHGGTSPCSGALINEWWIVTSFACAPSSTRLIAFLGEHDITTEEDTEQRIPIDSVVHHSPYRSPLHSLAMVRLSRPARFTHAVQPIPLPNCCPQPGQICQMSGFGSTTPNHYEPPRLLKCITAPVVDDRTCESTLQDFIYWSSGMICAGQADTDNCLNDSGSVMVCDGLLQGVQWFKNGCKNPAHASVYTKLCLYLDWIHDVMNSHTPTTTLVPTHPMGPH